MKKQLLLASAAAIFLLSACSNGTGTTDTNATTVTNPDSVVTTKTTTTTTTKAYSKGQLADRKLVDIKTNKQIVLKYDTVHYYYVDAATNKQPVSYYYYDPETRDTFDYRGYMVNNSLIIKDGDYTIDEDRLMTNPYNVELRNDIKPMTNTSDKPVDKKIKENGNSYKEKTDTSKIKITDRKTKIKIKKPQE